MTNFKIIETKVELKKYQEYWHSFRCTQPRERTLQGRLLPPPVKWEWDAQGYVRNIINGFKDGDTVVAAVDCSGSSPILLGVKWWRLLGADDEEGVRLHSIVTCVGLDARGAAPPHIGTELFEESMRIFESKYGLRCRNFTAVIHEKNYVSQKMALRHHHEPLQAPGSHEDELIEWGLYLSDGQSYFSLENPDS